MSHQPLDPRLHAYLDNELDNEARTAFEEDLRSIPELAAALADLQQQRRALRQHVEVSTEFEAALLKRLERPHSKFGPRGLWIAGTAAAALLTAFVFLQTLPDPIPMTAPAAEEFVLEESEPARPEPDITIGEENEQQLADAVVTPQRKDVAESLKKKNADVPAAPPDDEMLLRQQDSDTSLSAMPLPDWIPGQEALTAPGLFPFIEKREADRFASSDDDSGTAWVLYDPLYSIDCSSLALSVVGDQQFELSWQPVRDGTPHSCRLILPDGTVPVRLLRLPADDIN